jgi:restriction endonuclease
MVGDVNRDEFKQLQIRKTIEEHLQKELKLTPKGIKVLSLFFIDKVANYRFYDADGNPQKGKYALMFPLRTFLVMRLTRPFFIVSNSICAVMGLFL